MSDPHFNGPLAHLVRSAFAEGNRPDPWPEELDAAVRAPTAVPLCSNCLFPQGPHRWFCPHCAFPSGDYVATMPYLQVLAIGEFLRRGVIGPPERRRGVQFFLAVYSLTEYAIFAPVYWYWMFRRSQGKPICVEHRPSWEIDEEAQPDAGTPLTPIL